MGYKISFPNIDKKWQAFWLQNKTFKVIEDNKYPKEKRRYILDMFPYPSASGLHVGHPEGYTATDIYSRYLRAQGYQVLHPMGFDSFGLPAENYAIKTGQHPRISTEKNIDNFRKQIQRLGFSLDWDREISTHDPLYYHWTQWIFLQLYKKGLACESYAPINWCPSCLTGLANEEVNAKRQCDRCGTEVVKKKIRQWMLKISEYAERLLEDLKDLDWPDSLKAMQRHWIGRSEGCVIDFQLIATDKKPRNKISVFTTRPETIFGVSCLVVSPESELLFSLVTEDYFEQVSLYCKSVSIKSERDRRKMGQKKTGVFTGTYVMHPLITDRKIPVWVSDYVFADYGTGVVMAVPAHDLRDKEFAQTFELSVYPIFRSSQISIADQSSQIFVFDDNKDYILENSDFLNGLTVCDARKKICDYLENNKLGSRIVKYRLRDWVFSRQRFWGEPIPIVHCCECGLVPVPEKDLPLLLPEVTRYYTSGTGESPLALIDTWLICACPSCGGEGRRETNTMPQWAGSCWYYLRYLDSHNTKAFCDPEKEKYWMPVDLCIGGAEHAVLHLLYARFWHKVLFDLGLVSTSEPFKKLINQGLILGENQQKMSKSLGNVINPDDIVDEYGADTLRLYEMFMGPLEMSKEWNMRGVTGINRFLKRVYSIAWRIQDTTNPPELLLTLLHTMVKKVTQDTENFQFNVAISHMMVFINAYSKYDKCYTQIWEPFVKILAPYAPHLAEEMWEMMGHSTSISYSAWPEYNEKLIHESRITLGVQVNGKVRAELEVDKGSLAEELEKKALMHPKIQLILAEKTLVKVVAIPDRIVNIVVR